MSADTLYEQLRGHLHYLKLAAVAEQLAPALEHAERDRPGYTEFLTGLLKTEVDATEQRRLQGRLRFSKLPARKTLAQFDRDAQPSLDPRVRRSSISGRAVPLAMLAIMTRTTLLVAMTARC